MSKQGEKGNSVTILEAALDSVSKDALVEAITAYQDCPPDRQRHTVPIRLQSKVKAF